MRCARCLLLPRPRLVDDEATLTVVRSHTRTSAHGAETQPREKEKVHVLFHPVVICSRLARVPINTSMQIGNTHPRHSDRFFF